MHQNDTSQILFKNNQLKFFLFDAKYGNKYDERQIFEAPKRTQLKKHESEFTLSKTNKILICITKEIIFHGFEKCRLSHKKFIKHHHYVVQNLLIVDRVLSYSTETLKLKMDLRT